MPIYLFMNESPKRTYFYVKTKVASGKISVFGERVDNIYIT